MIWSGCFFHKAITFFEQFAHFFSGAVQPRPHGARGAIGNLCDGLIVQAFLVSKDEHGPFKSGKLGQRGLDVDSHVGAVVGGSTLVSGGEGLAVGPGDAFASEELKRFVDGNPA